MNFDRMKRCIGVAFCNCMATAIALEGLLALAIYLALAGYAADDPQQDVPFIVGVVAVWALLSIPLSLAIFLIRCYIRNPHADLLF